VALDHVFARAMAKNPAERFHSCREFTDASAQALTPGHNPIRTTTSPTYPIQVFDPRPPTDPRGPTATGSTDARTTYSSPHSTDLSSLTARRPRTGKRWMIVAAAAVVAVALAAGIGAWATRGDDSTKTNDVAANSSTTTTAAAAPTSVADAKAQNPQFAGKTITVVDVTDETNNQTGIAVYLDGGAQAKFLEALGFVYNLNYPNKGNQPSPQPFTNTEDGIQASDNSYVLAVRSDKAAGGGGLLGLPYEIADMKATVIPVDDPTTVSAFRSWGPNSQQVMLAKLVPLLHTHITQ
jgi:serine/threonine-protein kinase